MRLGLNSNTHERITNFYRCIVFLAAPAVTITTKHLTQAFLNLTRKFLGIHFFPLVSIID